MLYNVRVKEYPDGHKQYMYSERLIKRDMENDCETEKIFDGSHIDRKEKENMSRAIQKVYDLARSNNFNWFITLTLDPKQVDRTDYDACAELIKLFTDRLRKNGNKWIIVPELHDDGVSYHFHGLVQGNLPLTYWRNGIYNLNNYSYGHTAVMSVKDQARVATYIAKYLTKEINVPKGRKRYWASKSLAKPTEIYGRYSPEVVQDLLNLRYCKIIDGPYGRYYIAEE